MNMMKETVSHPVQINHLWHVKMEVADMLKTAFSELINNGNYEIKRILKKDINYRTVTYLELVDKAFICNFSGIVLRQTTQEMH